MFDMYIVCEDGFRTRDDGRPGGVVQVRMPYYRGLGLSMVEYRRALLDACTQRSIALEAYSPLGTGQHLFAATVKRVAQRVGRTPAQVLLRWCLQHDVPVICRVDVFPLLVQKQRKKWREKKQRVTRWMLPEEAAELVWEPELRDLILRFAAAFRERQSQA